MQVFEVFVITDFDWIDGIIVHFRLCNTQWNKHICIADFYCLLTEKKEEPLKRKRINKKKEKTKKKYNK